MTDDMKAITDDMDAREIESLSMLSRGFQELRDVNPELSFNVILDILAGLNEYVEAFFLIYSSPLFANACVPPCQQCGHTATRANLEGTFSPQTGYAKERDDDPWSCRDRGGRRHRWLVRRRHDAHNPWCGQRCGRFAGQAIAHRRTVVHAMVRGTENQMAEYIVMNATIAHCFIASAWTHFAPRSLRPIRTFCLAFPNLPSFPLIIHLMLPSLNPEQGFHPYLIIVTLYPGVLLYAHPRCFYYSRAEQIIPPTYSFYLCWHHPHTSYFCV